MSNRGGFETVSEMRTEDGLVGIITARHYSGRRYFSFSIKKEFDKNGKVEITSWFDPRQMASFRALLQKLEDEIYNLEDRERARARQTR